MLLCWFVIWLCNGDIDYWFIQISEFRVFGTLSHFYNDFSIALLE